MPYAGRALKRPHISINSQSTEVKHMTYKLTFSDRCYRRDKTTNTVNYIGMTFKSVAYATDYGLKKVKRDCRYLAPRNADECELREYLTDDLISIEAWSETFPDKKTKTFHDR